MNRLNDDAAWLVSEIAEAKRLASANGRPQLANSAIESGKIEEYDQDGTLVQIVGEQHDGTHAPVTVNGPPPPEPAAPVITAGIGSVEARWSGKFAADALSPMDFSHVALHAARAEVFAPSNETQLATITGELGDVAVVIIDAGEWTFGLVAVSKAGKWSPLSETVTIDVPDYPSPVDIQDELIQLDEKYDGVLTEAGNLGDRLDQAEQELTAHEGRLGTAEQRVSDAFVQIGTADGKATAAAGAAATAQSKADTAAQAAADAAGIASGKGKVLVQSTAPGAADRNAVTLWIDTTNGANTPKRWTTGTTWVAVTDKAATDAAAAAAQAAQAAASAQSAAGSAQATANNALTMAGTKGKVFYSASAPSGTGTAEGDLWRRIDISKNVIGEWYWSGSAWVSSQITTSAIANLDVGKLTVGTGVIADLVAQHIAGATAAFQTVDVKNLFVTTGTMTEAVINKLWADVVMSRKITTQMLAVGDFQNYIATGLGYNNEAIDWAQGLTPDFTDIPPGASVAFKSAVGQKTKGSTASRFDVTPGDEYEFVVWVKADVPNSRIYFEARDQNGAHAMTSTRIDDSDLFWGNTSYPVSGATVPTVWTKWRARMIPKPGVQQAYIASIYFNHSSGSETNAQVSIAGLSVKRRFGGEVIIDGSLKAKQIDVEDLAANSAFIADLTARIVKSEMFVGKEFQGGTFTGSVFQTSGIANAGLKLDSTGFRAYGPDGGEPVTEIRSDGGTVYSVTDSATGEVLAAIDSEGGFTGQSLAIAGEARIDGALVTGSDPLTSGHGSGDYGTTMNGRDVLGAAYMEAVNLHPDMQDGHAWMTMAPHGMKINAWNSRTNNLGPDNRWGWASGETRMMLTATMEAWPGRQYLLAYRTPAVRETSAGGSGDLGAALVRYASGTGVVNAGKGSAVPGTQVYLARGGGYQEAAVTTMLRCPEDIPEGRIMFGVEIYTYVGRTAQSTDTPGARRWELSVIDMGMRISANSGEDIDYRTGGVEPPTPDPAPKPKPAREYTDTINATWWQAYTGDGSKATHSTYSGSASQGRSPYAPGNGVMRGLVGFPSQLTRLSNATVKKIEVYVYAKHWHSSAGGTACIGVHNHASAPSSWSSAANDVKRQKLKKPEGRWITLPSSVHAGFKSGNTKGISFLPPSSSTSSEYYGLFTGNKTKLRITYTK